MFSVGSTLGGLHSSKVKGEYYHIKVILNVQEQQRRGIFVILESGERIWVPFEYENLSVFCYGCGRMGHDLQDCDVISNEIKQNADDELPFLAALKVESNLMGKESLKFGISARKIMKQWSYTREEIPKIKIKILMGKCSRKPCLSGEDDKCNNSNRIVAIVDDSNFKESFDPNRSFDLIETLGDTVMSSFLIIPLWYFGY